MTSKKVFSFTRFSSQNIKDVLSWVKNEEDLIYWSGNSFKHGISIDSFVQHLERKDLLPYQIIDQSKRIQAYGEVVIQDIERATLCRIIVNPVNRRQGLGTFLCKCLISEIENWNTIEEIALNTLTSNQAAVSCYKALGFKEQGLKKKCRRIKNSWHDLLYMSTFLNDKRRINV